MKFLCLLIVAFNLYTAPATVISSTAGVVTVETQDGNAWEYYGNCHSDSVTLIFNGNYTPQVEDDEIVFAY